MGWNPFEAIGNLYNDLTGRTSQNNKIESQKNQIKRDRDTLLGRMERQLALDRENATTTTNAMRLGANINQGTTEQNYGIGMQKAYLENIASEANYETMRVNDTRTIGGLTAGRSASGLKNSGTIADLLSTETSAIAKNESASRASIDYGIASLISGNQITRQSGLNDVAAIRTRADETMAQFNNGSAYMNLYNYNRTQTENNANSLISELQSQQDDIYSWQGYLGDTLKITAGVAMGVMAAPAAIPALGLGVGGSAILGGTLGGVSAAFA